jgi:hypothetical protein
VSDSSQGEGWWIASDGKWYPPDQVPGPAVPTEPATPDPTVVTPVETAPVTPADVAPEAPPTTPTPVVAPPPVAPPPVAPAPPPTAAPPPAPGSPAPPPGGYVPPPSGYAAPPPAAGYAPPPAAKSSNGCLKAFLIVAGIFVVLGIGLFVLLGFVVKKGVDSVSSDIKAQEKVEKRTGIHSNPLGFNQTHPPQDDVSTDFTCTTDSSGDMQASGKVTNHSSNASSYTITVSFRQNGSEVVTGGDVLLSVDAGADATWTASTATPPDGSFSCKIVDVERFDVDTFISTTTTRD